MDRDSFPIPQEWSNFTKQLYEIWDELGFDASVRQSHLNDILVQVSQTFQDRVRQERNVRDQTRRNIQTCASRISNIYRQLRYPENEAQDFISKSTVPQLTLIQSHDLMTRQLEKVLQERDELVNVLVELLRQMFGMEEKLGESTGTLELYAQLQEGNFSEAQALHFKQDPSQLDAERVIDIPTTVEKMRQKMVAVKQFIEVREREIATLENSVVELCVDLGEDVKSIKSCINNDPTVVKPLSMEVVKSLTSIETQLKSLKARREALIHEHANKLRSLWIQLDTPMSHQKEFIDSHHGRSIQVIKDCEAEIRRLEAEKLTRVRELVIAFRDKIRICWNELSVPDLDRKMFESRYDYDQATFTDEVLEQHRTLFFSLERMVTSAQPVIECIKEYQSLVQDKETYDTLTSNKERLLDRRYNMRAEETLRRKVANLPKLTDTLITVLESWKSNNNNQALIYQGVDFLAELLKQKALEEEFKQAKKRNLSSATSSSMLKSSVSLSNGPSVSNSTLRLTAKLASSSADSSSSVSTAPTSSKSSNHNQSDQQQTADPSEFYALKTPSKPISTLTKRNVIPPDTTGKSTTSTSKTQNAQASGIDSSSLTTPSRPRSDSRKPATTGKPVGARPRTQSATVSSADQNKVEPTKQHDKENMPSIAE